MLETSLTRVLGIDHPVIQASIGPWDAVELAGAVSNAGGLGTIGTATKTAAAVETEIARVRELTDRPFAVDAVAPLPVAAAGGIFDGRGLAAALVLGAQGVNVGTRFLASDEAAVSGDWKRAIVSASSEDAVKVEFADKVFPPGSPGAFSVRPRALRTKFIDEGLENPPDEATAERMRSELMRALAEGSAHELVPFTGETAGAIRDVVPAADIVRRFVTEAEAALTRTASATRAR